jgi:hypothetical protein
MVAIPVRALVLVALLAAPAFAFERGVALGLFAEDPGWSYGALLDEIKQLGADHVELVVAWYQRDGASVEIGDHPRYSPPEEAVRRTIREAHARGLSVLLFPIVRLWSPRAGEWRGTLQPRDRAAWFLSYKNKLVALARLAAEEKVASLSIGSELSTLDGAGDRAAWAMLVAEVRRRFSGALVYSGNWDHVREVALYDLVDRVGLCAYFPLGDDPLRAWQGLRAELTALARGRPIVFTEIGYLSQRGAAAWPWNEGAREPVDLEEQRRCYAAFCRTWRDAPDATLAGAYFWNWYGWGGATSRGYTPRGKPAAQEIRKFFAR